jgi:hypothetical protein
MYPQPAPYPHGRFDENKGEVQFERTVTERSNLFLTRFRASGSRFSKIFVSLAP